MLDDTEKTHASSWYAAYTRGLVYERQGQLDRAAGAQLQAIERLNDPSPFLIASLARARALCGDREAARALIEQARRLSSTQGSVFFHIGVAEAALGNTAAACELLSAACERKEVWTSFMLFDPRLDTLRSDPRFSELLSKLGLPAQSILVPSATAASVQPGGLGRSPAI